MTVEDLMPYCRKHWVAIREKLIQRKARLRVSPESVKRLKAKLKPLLRRGRGASLARTCRELAPILRGWTAYYRKVETKASFEVLDEWIRRNLRVIT